MNQPPPNRPPNTTRQGNAFTHETRSAVWNMAAVCGPEPNHPNGFDPNVWRRDVCGNVMRWADYGDRTSKYGWEVDHRVPVAAGGPDDLNNLQALQWENNAIKGDQNPWDCSSRGRLPSQ
jgi:hypothetical protein